MRWLCMLILVPVLLQASCGALPRTPGTAESPGEAMESRARAPRPAYNLSGYPKSARDGYIDGCETARKSEFARKEESRIAADALYRQGWSDGFSICSRK